MRAFAPLLEHGDFSVRPKALVSVVEHQTAGGGRRYAGRLRQRQALTCHQTVDASALAAKKRRGRSSRNRRNGDGPSFHIWNDGFTVLSLFGPSDDSLDVSHPSDDAALLRSLTTRADGSSAGAQSVSEPTEQNSTVEPGGLASTTGGSESELWSDSESSSNICGGSYS